VSLPVTRYLHPFEARAAHINAPLFYLRAQRQCDAAAESTPTTGTSGVLIEAVASGNRSSAANQTYQCILPCRLRFPTRSRFFSVEKYDSSSKLARRSARIETFATHRCEGCPIAASSGDR